MTQYEHDTFHPGPHSEWNCQLLSNSTAANGKRGKIVKINDLYNLPQDIVQNLESGGSVLSIAGATVTSAGINVPVGAAASILPTEIETSPIGSGNVNKKVLVVRVKTSVDRTTATPSQLSDSVFGTSGDPVNLSSQYAACTHGKLTFSPLQKLNTGDPSLDAPGVYEVEVSTSSRDHEFIREAITDKLNADWPNTPLPEVSWGDLNSNVPFDHVMYCMPPGTSMGIACM